jgi:uncharacterized membrane protein YhaH (DUF805 family)
LTPKSKLGCVINDRHGFPWWHPSGVVGRPTYLFTGLALFGLKFNVDRVLADRFREVWHLYQYWLPDPIWGSIAAPQNRSLIVALLIAAIPFIVVGVTLTLKRLRDAGLPLWLVALFFIPFVNLLFFTVLSIVPPAPEHDQLVTAQTWLPRSDRGAMATGVLAFVLCAVGGSVMAAKGSAYYGFSLFAGTPFLAGMACGIFLNARRDQGIAKTLAVTTSSLLISGGLMALLLIEGIICLAMALPFAIPLALFGALIGYYIARPSQPKGPQFTTAGLLLLMVPGMGYLEKVASPQPEDFSIRSEVVVNASPEVVWHNVVSFAELAPPTEALFKTGVAYPIRAEIAGSGPGAVRRCVFSTGAFVEPITVWKAPTRLAFSVQEQPPVMRELSWKRDFIPAHITDRYLRSTRGEFLLEPLPGNRTRLVGTTWYQLRFWPTSYWSLWSNGIIHRIHMRVLNHVKALSERS